MSNTTDPKPKKQHGGKRKGAGRKKAASKTYDPAEAALKYLADVAAGLVPPHRDRIAAAKALLPYQSPRSRAPVKSPRPSELQKQADFGKQRESQDDWARKSLEIRARMGRKDN